ncbi:MAG: hypothetical protein AB8B54_07435 [Sphingorhabdus sp.]
MVQTEIKPSQRLGKNTRPHKGKVIASGLFGYSIDDRNIQAFKPTEGYLRDMEQMPHFSPPSASRFAAQYLASNIGKTRSSS